MAFTRTGIAALIFLITPWSGTVPAAEQQIARFGEEFSKQNAIFRSRGDRVPDGYLTNRSLLSYTHTLARGFDRALAELGSSDRWLDIGAGSGQAVLDYYASRYDLMHPAREQLRGKAEAIAMSIEDRRSTGSQPGVKTNSENRMRYLAGRRLREYSPQELGQFKLITDVTGGFSYTSDISLFMEKVLQLLEPGGDFYTILVDVNAEAGSTRPFFSDTAYLTEIKNATGADIKVCSWLKSITCVEVSCEAKTHWQPPVEAFHLHKTCNQVSVPTLVPVQFEAGTPPERQFKYLN